MNDQFDPVLLDFHLGRLDEVERSALLNRLRSEPQLHAQNRELAAMFAALNSLRAHSAPADLVARTIARIGQPRRLPRLSWPHPAHESSERVGTLRLQNFRNIAAVAAAVVLMVGVGVPGLLQVRDRNQRIACSWNLAQVGRGVGSYASTFAGSLPFVGWGDRASWQPTAEPGVVNLPNRRHAYPLVSGRMVQTMVFICPSAKDVAMPADQVPLHSDFLESRNLSYAYQNMAGVRPSLAASSADLPIFADDNPCFDDGMPLFEAARALGLADPTRSNSHAHRGRGQNVLTLGGEVKWTATPNSGIDGDNMWTLKDVNRYTGREGPATAVDAHLLK